jgi:hypothetical protein
MARVSSHFDLQEPRFAQVVFETVGSTANGAITTLSLDSNQTLTPAQLLNGWLFRSIGAARTDTLPTAAALCEAVQGCYPGLGFTFRIRNISGGAFTHTLAVGAGGTAPTTGVAQTLTTAQSTEHAYRIVFTNVKAGTEAYNLYSLGAGAGW